MPPDAAPVIEAEDIHVSFGEKKVLCGISLRILPGETVALMGESGCGKTVLLRVLLGLLSADRGVVRLFGRPIAGLSDDEMIPLRTRMSVVYQGGALFSGMNVAENVALELNEVLRLPRAEVALRVKEALEAVGLGGVDTKMSPDELSGGMRKRLAVARAIAPRPQVIFYDEPTSGLDPVNSARIFGLIEDLHKRYRATSIVVSHDVNGVSGIADRMVLLHRGVVAFDGPPVAFHASKDPAVVAFRAQAPGLVAGRRPPA